MIHIPKVGDEVTIGGGVAGVRREIRGRVCGVDIEAQKFTVKPNGCDFGDRYVFNFSVIRDRDPDPEDIDAMHSMGDGLLAGLEARGKL